MNLSSTRRAAILNLVNKTKQIFHKVSLLCVFSSPVSSISHNDLIATCLNVYIWFRNKRDGKQMSPKARKENIVGAVIHCFLATIIRLLLLLNFIFLLITIAITIIVTILITIISVTVIGKIICCCDRRLQLLPLCLSTSRVTTIRLLHVQPILR